MMVMLLSLSNGPGQHRIPSSLLSLYLLVGYSELGPRQKQRTRGQGTWMAHGSGLAASSLGNNTPDPSSSGFN